MTEISFSNTRRRLRLCTNVSSSNCTSPSLRVISSSGDEICATSNECSGSNDTYRIMKDRLINHSADDPHLYANSHLTERDVQKLYTHQAPQHSFFGALKHTCRRYWTCTSLIAFINMTCPIIQCVRSYELSYALHDLAAGLSVGVASIPMGMSYALLARLPPEHGLYNNFFYPLIYMLFGTEPQVCVGTSAIESMMSADAVRKLVGQDATAPEILNASIALALAVGIVLIIMRTLGLGAVASFIADPVLNGFSTGSAIIIGTSQLRHVFGISVPPLSVPQTWLYISSHLEETNIIALIIAVSGVALLVLTKLANHRFIPKFPIPSSFFVMALFILINYLISTCTSYTVDIIGDIPAGFPDLQLLSLKQAPFSFFMLLKQAIFYSCFYFVIHITIAKTISQQRGDVLNANQEILAFGISSVVRSFFQCFPVATSLSRTSIANAAGARTPFYNIANAGVVALTISAVTPLLYYLPNAALASVVLYGVYGMMSFRAALRVSRVFVPDFLLWLICCVVVVMWGAMEGVIVGVTLSLLWILKKNAFPHIVSLGRLPETTIYRDVQRFEMAEETPGCKILRFDASLNFSNADQFENKINLVSRKQDNESSGRNEDGVQSNTSFKVIIIDASSINDMDMTAVRMLKNVSKQLQSRSIALLFANWKGPMRDFLERSQFYAAVPPEHCFLSLHDAVVWAQMFYIGKPSSSTVPNIVSVDKSTKGLGGESTQLPNLSCGSPRETQETSCHSSVENHFSSTEDHSSPQQQHVGSGQL